MLYLASVSFRFVSPPVSFYSIRSVPSHFVSVNAASYGDPRNAQPPLPLLSTELRHVFVFSRGTMGGRPALLLSACMSVQEDFPEMQSHDALTPPRCITPAVRSLARLSDGMRRIVAREEARWEERPMANTPRSRNSPFTARVSPFFALRTGPFLEMQLRKRKARSP